MGTWLFSPYFLTLDKAVGISEQTHAFLNNVFHVAASTKWCIQQVLSTCVWNMGFSISP